MPLHAFVPRRDNAQVWVPVVAALAAVPLVVQSDYVLGSAVLAGIYIILASSLNITNGYVGLFSFGQAAFYGIGAYTAAILATRLGWSFVFTLPAAGVVAAAVGALLAVLTLRLGGIFLALVTIAFQQIAYLVTLNWIALTRGPMGIPGVPSPVLLGWDISGNRREYYLVLALDLLTLFILARIVTSRLGRVFVAIRDDELAAQACGIATFPAKVLAFVIATFFAGAAGAVYAHHARFVSADSFGLDETFVILTMLIVGGMGSLLGPVLGAVLLVVLPEAFRFLAEYRGVAYGVILIGVILLRPEGIAGVPGIIQPLGARVPADTPASDEGIA